MGIYEDSQTSVREEPPPPPRTPVAPRSGRKPLGIHNHQHGTIPNDSTSKGTKKRVTSTMFMPPKVRSHEEHDTGSTTMSQPQPTSAQSFRRALRASLSPPGATSTASRNHTKQAEVVLPKVSFQMDTTEEDISTRSTVAVGGDVAAMSQASKSTAVPRGGGLLSKRTNLLVTGLGPPQRAVGVPRTSTPTSLLRTEMAFESDDSQDMDESLLVSPPGAVWNALGVAHDPLSASSTRLLIVPPATAATIHTITSSHKKAARQPAPQPWRSPPLQQKQPLPPSCLATTPEDVEEEDEDEDLPRALQRGVTPQGGVAVDLSTMFSREQKSPPEHLLQRLQQPVSVRRPQRDPVEPTTFSKPALALAPQPQPHSSPRDTPVNSSGMADMFFSLSSPPPRVWTKGFTVRDQQRVTTVVDELVDPAPPPATPTIPPPDSEPEEEENHSVDEKAKNKDAKGGVFLDMTNLFGAGGTSNDSKVAQAMPPPHLLERLSQKTAPKTQPPETKMSSAVLRIRPPAPSNMPQQGALMRSSQSMANSTQLPKPTVKSRSASGTNVTPLADTGKPRERVTATTMVVVKKKAKATLRAGATRVLSAEPAAAIKIPRAPLLKNAKFFPSASDPPPSTPRTTHKGISFEIAPPKESALVPKRRTTRTPTKKRTTKTITSPFKISRDANDWAGKQCDTFVTWLDYTFHPDEDEDADSSSGLRALVMHRRLAQVRFRAAELFQGSTMRMVRQVVQSEIARDRLTIRTDRDLYADLSLRELATQLLLSYTTPWLRLGLEVMYGECIVPLENLRQEGEDGTSTVARMRATLRNFVVERVLSDSTVLMKYTKGRTKVPSGKFEKLFREEMRTLVLYRLMVLILFLDHLKMNNVLDKVPRLFTKCSEVKSSKAVLLSFCRNFLSSEGDFMKHLSRMGLKVSYVQDPIDELEFNVENLAADLRDGGKLTRMTEIITEAPFKTLMQSLRLPAVSRLQKMHNVGIALTKLNDFGITLPHDLHAHHIVDAHREMVLKLMWSVISHVCMNKLLDEDKVAHEIENVLRSGQARRNMDGTRYRSLQRLSPDKPVNSSPEEALKSMLFRWCKAVCSNFGLHLQDFTNSFADGKAICYLVHYYHPGTLRREDILPTLNDPDAGLSQDQAIANERANSALAAKCVTELGGIPRMLPITDSQNPPDEKSMLLCLIYLCSRLMESSEEIFATILIQTCYRQYRNKILQEKKEAAALVIFRTWCDHKDQYYVAQQRRYAAAVAVLENFVCAHRPALERMKRDRLQREHKAAAATRIQRCFRGMIGRERFLYHLERQQSAIVIQKYFRRFTAEMVALEAAMERDAATRIQAVFRGWSVQHRFSTVVVATMELQRFIRGFLARRDFDKQVAAANVIQRAWWNWLEYADRQVAAIYIQKLARGRLARCKYQELLMQNQAATAIQKIWRGYVQATIFQISMEFTIAIQKVARGYVTRRNLPMQRVSRAVIVIQKTWRGFWAQVQFNMDVMDVVSIQTRARALIAKRAVVQRRGAIHCLQRAWRVAIVRRAMEREHMARRIQCAVRVWRAKQDLILRKGFYTAATMIQSTWRRFRCRNEFLRATVSAIWIQSSFRGFISKRSFCKSIEAVRKIQYCFKAHLNCVLRRRGAIRIQSQFRCIRDHRLFKKSRRSATTIQAIVRGWVTSNTYLDTRYAAITLQKCWRRYSAQLNFELDLLEIVISQSLVRRMLAQSEARKRRDSVQTIQTFARRCLALKELRQLQSKHKAYVQRCAASICVQRQARSFLARLHLMTCITATIRIQTHTRMRIRRAHFVSHKHCAVTLQANWRGYKTRNELATAKEAAISIQAIWRGYIKFVDFAIAYGNIVIVQSVARRFLGTKRASKRSKGVLKIQSICRRYLGMKECQSQRERRRIGLLQNHASTVIQSLYRGSFVRREMWWKHSAATLVQAHFRGRIVRVLYQLELYDITVAQAAVRRWLAFRLADRRAKSTLIIQSFARASIARHMASQLWAERKIFIARENAASSVQNAYRGYLVRRNIEALHGMATLIQKAFRGHYMYVAYRMLVVDVTIVQSLARRWLVKTWRSKANKSAIKIQALGRCFSALRQATVLRAKKALAESKNHAALMLQRMWRGRLSRKLSLKHSSARKIQKTWRCFVAHVDYLILQISVIRLQSSIRRMNAVKSYKKARLGLVQFQAAFRGYSSREYIRFISLSTTVVQAAFRRFVVRKAYLKHIRGITLLQAMSRGVRVRDELEFWNFAASEIQRVWRGFTQYCDFFIHIDATVKLQAFFRKEIAIRRFGELRLAARVEHSYYNHVTRIIQRAFRCYVQRMRLSEAACVIQRRARIYLRRRRATILDRGVKRLQALSRAKMVRKLRSTKLSAVVVRLAVATRKARNDPKLRIGFKTKHALEVLQNSKSLAGIMDAVKSLETSTRLSQLCCVLFTEADAARILLDLIRSCNRSIPHVELVQCILLTLDNVSQYRKLVPSFADCNSAEIFLDKMQMFRDKDGIFCLSIALLQRISECNPMVEEFCAMHEHLKRLRALHELSLRRGMSSNVSSKRAFKANRMKRREHFDRNAAVKALGVLTEKFDMLSLMAMPVEPHSREHFNFDDARCDSTNNNDQGRL